MRRHSLTLFVLLSCALWFPACTAKELTEVVVLIEAEDGLRAQSNTLSVLVTSVPEAPGAQPLYQNTNAGWNDALYTIALSPEDPKLPSRYAVEATALSGGQPIARARLISGYVVGETRYVRMLLEDQCVGVLECPARTTCRAGACVSAEVDPNEFAPSVDRAPSSAELPSAGPVLDAGGPARASSDRDAASADAARGDTSEPRDAGMSTSPPTPPDASVTPAPDAAIPVPSPGACKPGYYEGSLAGAYTYTGTGSGGVACVVAPEPSASTPALWMVLAADPASAATLRVVASCARTRMTSEFGTQNRPLLAQLGGTVDCTTGVFVGTLRGSYDLTLAPGLYSDFSGPTRARFVAASQSLEEGSWQGEEPPELGLSLGSGQGTWSARYVADAPPTTLEDTCATRFDGGAPP